MDVRLRLLAVALAALAVCAPPAAAAPGDLDASFSGDGRVSTLTSPDTFVARAVAMQPDGRIVVAGYSCNSGTCGPTGDSSFRLLRYTSDGGLDTDFGQGGMVTTTVGVGRSQAFDVIVRADGTIVAGGVASADALDPGSFALVGYKPNGTLDTTFGTGGRVITRVGEGFDAISDLVPGFGDHFTAVGQANAAGRDRFALARYDRRGKPDPSFGDMGSVVVPTSAPYAYGAAGAQLPDGRVVAVGASGNNSATESLRFSGTAVGFSGGATAPWIRPVGASYSYANAVVALADGRVLSAGVATERLGNPAMALMRTSPTGVLDRTWDGDGLATGARRRRHRGQRPRARRRGARGGGRRRHHRRRPRVRGRALRRRRRARPQLRRRHRAHELPRHLARPRHRDRPAGRRQARGGGHRLQLRERRAVQRRHRAARARPLPGRPVGGAAPGRRHAAAGHEGRSSSRCPRG